MLHEPATSPDYVPAPPAETEKGHPTDRRLAAIEKQVREVMYVDYAFEPEMEDLNAEDMAILMRGGRQFLISFEGRLKLDSEQAYDMLDVAFREFNVTVLFREQMTSGSLKHVIHILEGRFAPPGRPAYMLNLILFIATIFSVLITGASIVINNEIAPNDPALAQQMAENILTEMWRGWPYALSILLILVAHEGGHYVMMRRRGVDSTLPFFIPVPILSPFGTFGAAIMLRSPMKNRKVLLDVGAAGPIAGVVMAIPVLLLGLSTANLISLQPNMISEGNSVLYILAKLIRFGEVLPSGTQDVLVNQLTWAGWTGLFVTALNLIPLGQLDGGHVIYSILGDQARRLYFPLLGLMFFLTVFVSNVWMMLFVILFLLGRVYAVPLDNITRLDPRRQTIAISMLLLFLLVFVPNPLAQSDDAQGALAAAPQISMLLLTGIVMLRKRFSG